MAKNTEERAADLLLNKAIKFSIPKRSILKHIGKKERKILIYPSYLGTLYEISRIALTLDFEEILIEKDPLYECRVLIKNHVKDMALIVAIAILNSRVKIWLFKRLLSSYLYWHLNPETLLSLSLHVIELNNLQDFMNSIRSARGWRITQPKNDLSPTENGG